MVYFTKGYTMNEIIIGKVKLDLTYYSGKDQYSDGDIENVILNIVKSTDNYDAEIAKSDRFEVFYHLSKEREMITQMMNIGKKDTILEVGSGCGAITGSLALRGKKVECIELSKRRSLINAHRNRNKENIWIYVGNYEDIRLENKYDIITLIGVLEYAGHYIHASDPYQTFLKSIKEKMSEEGKGYIAIENRLGMKYLSGCKEDHVGKEFYGIEGYNKNTKIRTFSYYELKELFQSVGFSHCDFYYPYPDYKFPNVVFSDKFLPKKGDLQKYGTNYYSSRMQTFDEIKAFDSLIMHQEFKIFTNSFLVELRK